jgi:hypothetical protein
MERVLVEPTGAGYRCGGAEPAPATLCCRGKGHETYQIVGTVRLPLMMAVAAEAMMNEEGERDQRFCAGIAAGCVPETGNCPLMLATDQLEAVDAG